MHMIISTQDLKLICSKVQGAVDTGDESIVNKSLVLRTEGENLLACVTNREHYVKAKVDIGFDDDETFYAAIPSALFLKLVPKLTSETVELSVDNANNCLRMKADGKYQLPLVYDDGEQVKLPDINIDNVESEFDLSTDILRSILLYNSKELSKINSKYEDVRTMYYIDSEGAITFTTGACVNTFKLGVDIKFLLNQRLVKLFKLISGDSVHVTYGTREVLDGIEEACILISAEDVDITAVLPSDEELLRKVPAKNIRARAFKEYPHVHEIPCDALLKSIDRLTLLSDQSSSHAYGKFEFGGDYLTVYDRDRNNQETIYFDGDSSTDLYTATLSFDDVRLALENATEPTAYFYVGDGQAIVVSKGDIRNVIPEAMVD